MENKELEMDADESVPENVARQRELLKDIELRRRMKSIVVPTDDGDIRAILRQLGEPITLFGEKEMERSLRLRQLLATASEEQIAALNVEAGVQTETRVPTNKIFYTEGGSDLELARHQIAQYSLRKAALRLAAERASSTASAESLAQDQDRTENSVRTIVNQSSELGDERPISSCSISPDGARLLTGSWSGHVRLWSLPDCRQHHSLKAHTERVTDVTWHPEATISDLSSGSLAFASAAADKTAALWDQNGTRLRQLSGHSDRLARIAFHPMGRHLGTASFDQTWRLWDVETGACIQEQEGHSRAVYVVCFQVDGSLAASGGLDSLGRLWDVRTGKNILNLEGHIKSILSMDFSPNGYVLATGSEDNTVRVYDLRRRDVLAVLPGHTSLVSRVRFEPNNGSYLLTCGYDRTSKLWTAPSFKLSRTLLGHEDKVMDGDISPSTDHTIVTTGFDRTVKLFYPSTPIEVDMVQ